MMKRSLNTGAIDMLFRICQRLIAICCCVLMFTSVAGVSFQGVSSVRICSYIGQAVKLLSNISNDHADPSLYNENGTIIASWKENTNTIEYMDPNYSGKIYMEENRNIWILSLERKDAGRYIFKFGVQIERLDIELTVKGVCTEALESDGKQNHIIIVYEEQVTANSCCKELTEEQLRECPNNHPDFPKEGISHDTATAWSKKDYTEGRVMPDQILQLLCNHSQKNMMEPCGSCDPLIIGMLSAILIITSLNIVLTNKTCIGNGWITGKHWIQETLCSKHMRPKELSKSKETTSVTIEESESLTEFQVRDWLKLHPDFMKKYYDEHENYHQSIIPILDELGIKVKETGTVVEVNQRQLVSTEMKVIASETCSSESSDEDEHHLQVTLPTFDELGVTVKAKATGREGNSKNTDECDIHHQATPTLDELGITVKGTGREGNQRQWMSSQEKVITYETCSSSSSDSIDSFTETDHSGMQSIHKNEKKADPEGDKAQTDSAENSGESVKEDPNSDDDSNEPLLGKSFNPK